MTMILFCTGKLPRGAKWQTDKERKPRNGKKYACAYCGQRTVRPYRWVYGAKSCGKCNELFGN
jgi:predicted SprT family Zn-dependent metalloprotease